MEVCMEKIEFRLEVPAVTAVIKVSGRKYDKEGDFTSIEIETPALHIVFNLPGKYESGFAQKRLAEGLCRLDTKGLLSLANTRLWPVIQQLP